MLGLLVAVSLAASGGEVVAQPETLARPWLLWGGLAPGMRAGRAAGGQGLLGLSRRVTPHLRPELDLGIGYFGGPEQVVGSMRLGVNVDLARGPLVPYGWVAFAHNHEMPLMMAKESPFAMVLGLSDSGMVHRSGLEAGGGINAHLPVGPDAPLDPVVGARLSAMGLLGSGPSWSASLIAMIGADF
jgi:hypothetical protein